MYVSGYISERRNGLIMSVSQSTNARFDALVSAGFGLNPTI